jgi:RNA polymerase sigma factor (sigma-70 family)
MNDEPRARADAELLHAADEDGFTELYRRHALTIYTWFGARVAWAANDLTAETFAQAWLSRRRFRDDREGSALPWLYGIARNVLRDSARRDRVETRARDRLGLPLELVDDDAYDAVDDRLSPRRSLAEAVERLPEDERRALELRVVDELPYAEIAQRLALRPAAVRLRVSRALRRLAVANPKEEL